MTICGCPLSRSLLGVKRTSPVAAHMSANDPKQTCQAPHVINRDRKAAPPEASVPYGTQVDIVPAHYWDTRVGFVRHGLSDVKQTSASRDAYVWYSGTQHRVPMHQISRCLPQSVAAMIRVWRRRSRRATMNSYLRVASAGLTALVIGAGPTQAAIVSAVSGTINSGGPGFGTLTETFNQAGLFTNYVSGVTNFDTYIAGNPLHDWVFVGNEWFADGPTANVTYDLGSVLNINKLALWNEDASGIGTLNLSYSIDGVTFVSLLSGLKPTDNPVNENYGADVFSFGSTALRYLQLDMSDCPQPSGTGFNACAIGEVAFSSVAAPSEVPIPGALPLFFSGLGALGLIGWRRKKKTVALAA
jgi:hypothetical protein